MVITSRAVHPSLQAGHRYFVWHILKSASQTIILRMITAIAGKEKRPSCLSWWNLSSWMHLFAFLIYFLLIRTIWPSCLKECSLQFWSLPVITSILQPAARGAGRGILSSCSTNPSLLACQAPGAHQQCLWSLCRGKNPGCKLTDSLILWECFCICKILHALGFLSLPSRCLERQLSCSVWNAFFSPLHKKIFPASSFPVRVLKAKPKILNAERSALGSMSTMS